MSETTHISEHQQGYFRDSDDLVGGAYGRWELDRSSMDLQGDLWRAFDTRERPSELAIRLLREGRSVSMLDAGCGTGHTLYDLQHFILKLLDCDPRALQMTGLNDQDFSAESMWAKVRVACRQGAIDYQVGNVEAMPFANDTFDIAYSYEVAQYVQNVPAMIRELGRVTKPGGQFFFTLCNTQPQQADIDQCLAQMRTQGYDIESKTLAPEGFTFSWEQAKPRTIYAAVKA